MWEGGGRLGENCSQGLVGLPRIGKCSGPACGATSLRG